MKNLSNEMLKVAAASIALSRIRKRRNMEKEAGMRESLIKMLGGSAKKSKVLPALLSALGVGGLGAAAYTEKDRLGDLLNRAMQETGLREEERPWYDIF